MNKNWRYYGRTSWLASVIYMLIIGLMFYFILSWKLESGLFLGCIIYIALSSALGFMIGILYNKGVKLSIKGNYQNAILEFKRSYDFFTKHKFIDKLRYLFMSFPSKESYAELALCNIAYNYSLAGDMGNAKEYYERALKKFPKSEIAKASLKSMEESAKDIQAE